MNIQEVNDLIRNRRAIYPATYTGEIIPDEKVRTVLENANWAPNHKKTEPWRFIIFKDKALQRLSSYLADYYVENTPKGKFSQTKYKKTINKTVNCSHVIAICMQRDPEESLPEWEEKAAVACAVQNMWLTCSAMGIGCYWSTPKAALDAKRFLQLDKGQQCLGLFYMGIPKPVAMNIPGQRGPIDEKVQWQTT